MNVMRIITVTKIDRALSLNPYAFSPYSLFHFVPNAGLSPNPQLARHADSIAGGIWEFGSHLLPNLWGYMW